jgi:hypothetical protein
MTEGKVIQGLDVIDLIVIVGQKNKKFTAITLQEMEEVLGKDSKEYATVRKIFLDCFNNYTRSIMRSIFGDDFEYIKHV